MNAELIILLNKCESRNGISEWILKLKQDSYKNKRI